MNGRITILGLGLLCALLTSAFAAQSASAISGTTAFTCSKAAATKDRVGEHCLNSEGTEEYGHVGIAQDKATELAITNAKSLNNTTVPSSLIFKAFVEESQFELAVAGISGSGWMENGVAASGEHYIHGEGSITLTGVTVKAPAGKGCKVYTDNEGAGTEGEEGVIHTKELLLTSEKQGDALKFSAADGGNLMTFFVTCEEERRVPAIEGTWSCSGSVQGQPNGATVNFTHSTVTAENLLKCNKGTKAGIDGNLTLSGREDGSGGAYTPVATTTVTTELVTGTTAFTCVKGKGMLRGEHCLTTGSAAVEYGHDEIARDQTTEVTATNAKTNNETSEASIGKLKVTIAGVPLELRTTGVSGSGWMENKLTPSEEHYAQGEGTLTFTGVTVAEPAGRGCKVTTHTEDGTGGANEEGAVGVIHTRELKATTEGQGDFVKFEPADGPTESFAKFFVTCEVGKKIPAIEGTWKCNGSVNGVPNGATSEFTHGETTSQNALKCKGTKAGFEGSFTLSAREEGSGGAYTPLAATTVGT